MIGVLTFSFETEPKSVMIYDWVLTFSFETEPKSVMIYDWGPYILI